MVVAVPVLAGSGKPPPRRFSSKCSGSKMRKVSRLQPRPKGGGRSENRLSPHRRQSLIVWTDASGLPAADHAGPRRGQGTAHAGCDPGGPLLPLKGEGGKKDEKAEAAKKVASKFATTFPLRWLRRWR